MYTYIYIYVCIRIYIYSVRVCVCVCVCVCVYRSAVADSDACSKDAQGGSKQPVESLRAAPADQPPQAPTPCSRVLLMCC